MLACAVLQPFHWGPGLFFNLGWDWTDLRDEYLGTSDTYFMVSRAALWLVCLLLATKGLRRGMMELYARRPSSTGSAPLSARVLDVVRSLHMKVLGPTEGFSKPGVEGEESVYHSAGLASLSGYWLPHYGSDVLGIVIGTVHAAFLTYILTAYTALIPQLTGAHAAWRVWLPFHVLGTYAFNHWLFLAYHACPPLVPAAAISAAGELRPLGAVVAAGSVSPVSPGGANSPYHAPFSAVTRGYPLFRSVGWLAFWEVTLYVLMRRTFYPEFVVKMFVMFPLIGCVLVAAINMNRDVWRSVEQSRAYYAGHHKDAAGIAAGGAAAGVLVPMLPGGGRR